MLNPVAQTNRARVLSLIEVAVLSTLLLALHAGAADVVIRSCRLPSGISVLDDPACEKSAPLTAEQQREFTRLLDQRRSAEQQRQTTTAPAGARQVLTNADVTRQLLDLSAHAAPAAVNLGGEYARCVFNFNSLYRRLEQQCHGPRLTYSPMLPAQEEALALMQQSRVRCTVEQRRMPQTHRIEIRRWCE